MSETKVMVSGKGRCFAASALFLVLMLFSPARVMGTVWTDASGFPLVGKADDSTGTRYERLPSSLEGKVRDAVWYLGRNSAGLAIRFSSNSGSVRARWTSMSGNTMNHMTETGVRGLDLYVYHDGEWRFAGSGRPKGKTTESILISGMEPENREFMLYLSLYDGIESLEIGTDDGSVIQGPHINSPSMEKPVIMYGTSILQGGCASRPGMAHTNILGRRLNREVINLGFSGNAFLDFEIAELMASVNDPGVYVLDYVPNASVEMIDEKGERFFRILRDAHPDVPVIFVEDPPFPHSVFDMAIKKELDRKNLALKRLFVRLRKTGEKRIFYVESDTMIGFDGEATVDGIHFTDLGMERYVDCLLPVIRKALK